jgi:hypothetical protein
MLTRNFNINSAINVGTASGCTITLAAKDNRLLAVSE